MCRQEDFLIKSQGFQKNWIPANAVFMRILQGKTETGNKK